MLQKLWEEKSLNGLPVVFVTIVMARKFLVEVDPSELEELRYGYKGA